MIHSKLKTQNSTLYSPFTPHASRLSPHVLEKAIANLQDAT